MCPALSAASVVRQARPPAPPRPATLPSVEVLRVPARWPYTALSWAGAGLFGSGIASIAEVPGWERPCQVLGAGGASVSAVLGERHRRRRQLVVNIDVALAPLLGIRGAVRVRRWSGFDGYGVGIPHRVRIQYVPGADALQPDWDTQIIRSVERLVGARYRIHAHDTARCHLVLALAGDAMPDEAAQAPAQVRAERIVRELLGVTASITPVWEGPELIALEVQHEAGIRVAGAAQRGRIERTVSTMLLGRWRARWDLVGDHVRFEQRPILPKQVDHPPYALTPTNLYNLQLAVDEDDETILWRMRSGQPHLMVVGPTGSGKTVLIQGVVTQATRRGWEVFILDPKRIEYLGLRDWPNVRLVATVVEHQAAVIHYLYRLMDDRYAQIEARKATEDDFEPIIVVLDEYRAMVAELAKWYARIKGPRMPSKCPLLEELSLLASKARSAGIHLVLGTQRPDAEFVTGEMRDNFRCRVSLGRLSPQGALMMWDAAYIGVALPSEVQGRATAVASDGRFVEAQVYWTPDPRRVRPDQFGDRALLERLRPTTVTHPPVVVVPPEVDEEAGQLGYYDYIDAQLVPADTRPDLVLAAPQSTSPTGRPALSPAFSPAFSPTLSPTIRPAPRPAPSPAIVRPRLWAVPADPATATTETPAPLNEAEPEETSEDQTKGYDEAQDVPVEQLAPGDLVLVDEEGAGWAVVEAIEPDLVEDGFWCVDWRSADDGRGSVSVCEGDLVTARHPLDEFQDA